MINSPTTQPANQQAVELSSSNRFRSWLVFIFRLLLLGVSGSFAVLIGIAIAGFFPAKVSEPPFMERAINRSSALFDSIQRLPQPWRQSTPDATPSASTGTNAASTTAAAPLQGAERQRLEAELTQIQGDLEKLRDRTTAIESQLGESNTATALEARLQAIQQQLNPNSPTSSSSTTGTSPNPSDALKVTLPSDSLFATNEPVLRTGSQVILDNIVNDLRRYPGATIRVNAYTDASNAGSNAAADRIRTFEQAKVVQQYLASVLGENYHWIVIGYGHSQSLGKSNTPADRQRNRRIEIEIEPR